MKPFSSAVVLSPGVWQQLIEPITDNDPVGQSAQRLAALLNSVLTLSPSDLQRPFELQLDHSQRSGTLVTAHLSQLQLARITPRSGPAFLLIRLPDESAVDIAAL
ncbi:hypothetical protein D3C77_521990 [compost metagenome]